MSPPSRPCWAHHHGVRPLRMWGGSPRQAAWQRQDPGMQGLADAAKGRDTNLQSVTTP